MRRRFQNGGLASLIQPQRGAGRGSLGYAPPYGGSDVGVPSSAWPVGSMASADPAYDTQTAVNSGVLDLGTGFRRGGPVRRRGFQDGGVLEEEMMMPGMGGPPDAMPQGFPPMSEPPALAMEMMQGGPPPTDPGFGGEVGPEGQLSDEELIAIYMDAKAALEGNHPNPEAALDLFEETFGPEALAALEASVDGVDSDGLSDSIPGNIDGMEEVALSEGEYVIPSDVVSGIGNGDTNSGADRLGGMVEEIRMARTGAPGMPGQIDFEEFKGRV